MMHIAVEKDQPPPAKRDRVAWLRGHHFIDDKRVWAANLLLHDYECADPDRGARGSMQPRGQREARRIEGPLSGVLAKQRIAMVKDLVGDDFAEILTLVVIESVALAEVAEIVGIHPKAVLPMVKAGLEVLWRHYMRDKRQ